MNAYSHATYCKIFSCIPDGKPKTIEDILGIMLRLEQLHERKAHDQNISRDAFIASFHSNGGSFINSLAGALMTFGGKHGPISQVRQCIEFDGAIDGIYYGFGSNVTSGEDVHVLNIIKDISDVIVSEYDKYLTSKPAVFARTETNFDRCATRHYRVMAYIKRYQDDLQAKGHWPNAALATVLFANTFGLSDAEAECIMITPRISVWMNCALKAQEILKDKKQFTYTEQNPIEVPKGEGSTTTTIHK